jgi:hypothetical protein
VKKSKIEGSTEFLDQIWLPIVSGGKIFADKANIRGIRGFSTIHSALLGPKFGERNHTLCPESTIFWGGQASMLRPNMPGSYLLTATKLSTVLLLKMIFLMRTLHQPSNIRKAPFNLPRTEEFSPDNMQLKDRKTDHNCYCVLSTLSKRKKKKSTNRLVTMRDPSYPETETPRIVFDQLSSAPHSLPPHDRLYLIRHPECGRPRYGREKSARGAEVPF